MQNTSGLRSILSHHGAYRLFRKLTGSDKLHRILVEQYIRPCPGDVVLDIGCGPADILAWMPEVRYYGLDLSADYLAAARSRYPDRGSFTCGSVDDLDPAGMPPCDIVLALGVLHHLDDGQVVGLLAKVRTLLKPGGRFISYDPCFAQRQHVVARWIHRCDRGRNVRFDGPMASLAGHALSGVRHVVRHDMCRVPSTVIVLQYTAEAAGG